LINLHSFIPNSIYFLIKYQNFSRFLPFFCKKFLMQGLLIKPGDESKTEVLVLGPVNKRHEVMAKAIGCYNIERLPHLGQRRPIVYEKDGERKVYTLDLFCDEEGLLRKDPVHNPCAEFTYNILGAGPTWSGVCGSVVAVDEHHSLTLDDWKKICQAVYYDEDMAQKNYDRGFPEQRRAGKRRTKKTKTEVPAKPEAFVLQDEEEK
jgi:hypothetical protein